MCGIKGVRRDRIAESISRECCPVCYARFLKEARATTSACIDSAALSAANLLAVTHPDDRFRERETLLECFRVRLDQLLEQASREGLSARTTPCR